MDNVELSRKLSVERHDLDAALFFNRYLNFSLGKFHDEFIYGRHMIIEEVNNDLATLPAGAKVLDVGCGTGHFADFIAQKGFDVVGLEPAKNMISIARELFPKITFVEGISAKIPYPDNSFDYILAIEVFRYLDKADNEASFKEFHRVLKPGGKILVTQVSRNASDYYYQYYHLTNVFKRMFGKQLHYCYFTNTQEQTEMVKNAGFKNINVFGRMHGYIRMFYKFGNGIGQMFTKRVDKKDDKQIFNDARGADKSGHLIVKAQK
ncbi:MAG: methyltransferase domain-containing protein [Bacteroidetes bacterium]|nr:methyltransferase domain-containing protein [Bacteroidota bacterium]